MATIFQSTVGQINNRQTRNIVIWSGKGGSGKTTLAQNLAWWLATFGRKVGLIDTDSYANSSNFINMMLIAIAQRYTLSHVIQQERSLLDAMYQVRDGLYVVPSDDNIGNANSYIVVNQEQEIMLSRYNDMQATIGARPEKVPDWHKEASISPRYFSNPAPVDDTRIRERPSYIDYMVWDFPGEPGAIGKAILELPNCEIWAPIVLEPLPLQGFAQMKAQINKQFRNFPERKPRLAGVIPYDLTHKKKETVSEFVKLRTAHPDAFRRPVHEDLNVPVTQNYYPAQAIYETKRTIRAGLEMFEIAARLDGYTGTIDGKLFCKHCDDIDSWFQEQMAVVASREGA